MFSVTCILRILKLLAENLHVLLGLRDGGDGILGRLDLVLELIDHHLGGVGGDDGILPRLLGFGGGVVRVGGDVASPHLDNLELDDGDGLLVSPVFVDRVLEFDRELEGAVGHCVDAAEAFSDAAVASSSFFSAVAISSSEEPELRTRESSW